MPLVPYLLRLRRCTKGNALMIMAFALPILLGGAGMAVDMIQWANWKRELQRSADSAALAGAMSLARSQDVQRAVARDILLTNDQTLSSSPLVQTPPTEGSHTANPRSVRVQLTVRQALPFSSMFLASAPLVRATAVATGADDGQFCVIALENTTALSVEMQGSSSVALGCGLATNALGANAVQFNGGASSIMATPVAAVGGLLPAPNYASGTSLRPFSLPQRDPFATVPNPVIPGGCNGQLNVGSNATASISPGCWRGWRVQGTLNLSPGTYIIDGGSVSFGAQARVTGTGVTIVLTSSSASSNPSSVATIDINAGAQVSLTAPSSGTYTGLIIYQDRRAADLITNRVGGNANSFFQGAIYLPRQRLEFSGTSGMSTNCLQMVARRLSFSGNSSISNVCPANSGSAALRGTVVRLVE